MLLTASLITGQRRSLRAAGALASSRPVARTLPRSRWPVRVPAAWAAVFALSVQLLAGILCLSGAAPGRAVDDGGHAAWPICHAQVEAVGGGTSDDGGQVPDHPQPCAFCLLHCLGGLPAAPVVRWAAPVPVVASVARVSVAVARPLSRVPTDAAPRGPPAIG